MRITRSAKLLLKRYLIVNYQQVISILTTVVKRIILSIIN